MSYAGNSAAFHRQHSTNVNLSSFFSFLFFSSFLNGVVSAEPSVRKKLGRKLASAEFSAQTGVSCYYSERLHLRLCVNKRRKKSRTVYHARSTLQCHTHTTARNTNKVHIRTTAFLHQSPPGHHFYDQDPLFILPLQNMLSNWASFYEEGNP